MPPVLNAHTCAAWQRFDGEVPSSRAEQLLQMWASSRGKSSEVDGLEHSFRSIILKCQPIGVS